MNIWRHLLVRHVWGACSHAIYFSLVTWAKFTCDQYFLLSLNLRSFAGEIRNTPVVGPPRLSLHSNRCAKYIRHKQKCEICKKPGWKTQNYLTVLDGEKDLFEWSLVSFFSVLFCCRCFNFFSCAVYCVHAICWYIQGNLNKEQNNNLGVISASWFCVGYFLFGSKMLLNCEGTRNRERTRGTGKYEKWNKTERWVMKSLIQLGFKIAFVPRIPIPHPTPLSSLLFIS